MIKINITVEKTLPFKESKNRLDFLLVEKKRIED